MVVVLWDHADSLLVDLDQEGLRSGWQKGHTLLTGGCKQGLIPAGQREPEAKGQFEVGGVVGAKAVAAGEGQSVVPCAGDGGLIDEDRQGFQQPQEGADRSAGDPPSPLRLDQHVACFPEPEGRNPGLAHLQTPEEKPGLGAGLIGETSRRR